MQVYPFLMHHYNATASLKGLKFLTDLVLLMDIFFVKSETMQLVSVSMGII